MPRIADRFAGAVVGLSAAAGVLVAYVLTLAPGVVWAGAGIDSGDLAAAVAVGGVPHPTGYPTLMLLGLAVRAIPLGDLALRLNVLTALAAAGSLVPLGLLAARLRPSAGTPMPLPEAAGGSTVLALYGLAPLIWSNAIVTEVYALAGLFLWGALYAGVRARVCLDAGRGWRWAVASGVLLGIGVGAHLTVALAVPALAAVLLSERVTRRGAIRRGALVAASIAAGCMVYAYLPIAASLDPPINWGAPSTPERFWSVVSAEIYHSRVGAREPGAVASKAAWLLGEIVRQLTWVILPLLGAGGVALTRRNRPVALATVWLAVSALAVGAVYNSRDDEVFILSALAVSALWSALGVCEVGRLAWLAGGGARRLVAGTLAAILIITALIRGTELVPAISMRNATHAGAFAHALLAQADPDSVILTEDDRATFALWYERYGSGGRSDVTIVDQRLWQFAWYREILHRRAGIPTEASPSTALANGIWPSDRTLWAVDIAVTGDRSADVLATVRVLEPP